jgi:hypothetical protein
MKMGLDAFYGFSGNPIKPRHKRYRRFRRFAKVGQFGRVERFRRYIERHALRVCSVATTPKYMPCGCV